MRQVSIASFLMAVSIVGMAAPAQALKVTYTTLVTSDPATQGGRKFDIPVFSPSQPTVKFNKIAKKFLAPSIDQQRVVFVAATEPISLGPSRQPISVSGTGLFHEFSGDLKTIETQMDTRTNSGGVISSVKFFYDLPDIEGVNVAYTRNKLQSEPSGITGTVNVNLWRSSNPTKIQALAANCNYSFSNATSPISNAVTVGKDKVTILAGAANGCPVGSSNGQRALVQATPGSSKLTTIVDSNTKVPGSSIPFGSRFSDLTAKGSSVLFNDGSGIYLFKEGKLSTSVKPEQTVPGNGGKLVGINSNDLDGNTVAFVGTTTFNRVPGIYLKGQNLTKVARSGEPIPGGSRNFYDLLTVKISGSTILFTESGVNGGEGQGKSLYVRYGGKITKLISEGGKFKGKTILSIGLGKRPLDDNTIVFALEFTDGNGSVVKAKLSP